MFTSKEDVLRKRNECLNLVKPNNRKIRLIRVDKHESDAHLTAKIKKALFLTSQGCDWIMEARFLNGSRCDILDLDSFTCYEIAVSESEESLKNKAKKYPKGLKIKVVRV